MFVRMYMTKGPACAAPEDNIAGALQKMERGGFRRLPVVEKNRLVGILALGQVNNAVALGAESAPVREYMTRNPIIVRPDDTLEDAARLMRDHKIGAVPVVLEEQVVGILTESDLFQALMGVLGFGLPGVRVTFDTNPTENELDSFLELVHSFGLELVSMSSAIDERTERRIITIRVDGRGLELFLDSLWKKNFRLLRVVWDDRPVGLR